MSKATYHPYMPKEQREWLKKLISKGVMIELLDCNGNVIDLEENEDLDFSSKLECYRIPTQPIPDIPDWRELCHEMKEKGIRFFHNGVLNKHCVFDDRREYYKIQPQSLPYWKEELNFEIEDTEYPEWRPPAAETKGKMNKDTSKFEDNPHHELQIQWHEDMLHHLRTDEPMREWQFRRVTSCGAVNEWSRIDWPEWRRKDVEYRRKPRTVTYWTFVMQSDGEPPEAIIGYILDEAKHLMRHYKELYPSAKFSPIIETIIELEDDKG